MSPHVEYIIKSLDLGIDYALKHQCLDKTGRFYGALVLPAKGYCGGEDAGGIARNYILGYYCEGSRYCHDGLMLERARIALEFVLGMEKSDGTFDLLETNFHDGAQTSFIVTNVAPAVLVMREKTRHTPEEDALYTVLERFIDRASDGMINGGFHTPNHRWVMSSALGMCHALNGRRDCLEKMRLLLGEGIDQDIDGEYTEHSGGVYNIICDRAFIILAFVCKMPGLYDTVAKNLRMVYKYIEPDLTINTMNSSRQDAGTNPTWLIYYGLYLFMAFRTGDKTFRFVADRMLEQFCGALSWAGLKAGGGYVPAFEYLPFMLLDDTLKSEWTPGETESPDFDYTKLFESSGVLRHRKGDFSLTLVKDNHDFAFIKHKRHGALIRLCGTFYAQGQFEAQEITQGEGVWNLTYKKRWGYKSPLPERQDTTDWRKMDHTKRADVMMQDFVVHVNVVILDSGAVFSVHTEGVESVLMKFEILLDPGADYHSGGVYLRPKPGDYVIQGADEGKYVYPDGSALSIKGGSLLNTYAEHMRGSVPPDGARFTVAMTAQTPMDQTFRLEFLD